MSDIERSAREHGMEQAAEQADSLDSRCPVAGVDPDFSVERIAELALHDPEELVKSPLIWKCLTCLMCSDSTDGSVDMSGFIRDVREQARAEGFSGRETHGGLILGAQRLSADPARVPQRTDWVSEQGLQTAQGKGDYILWTGGAPFLSAAVPGIGYSPLDTARAAVRILNRLGIEPVVLEQERFSGHDLLWTGDTEHFSELASLNIRAIQESGASGVIAVSPHDMYTLSRTYPETDSSFDVNVCHITEFIADRLSELEFREYTGRVTFHDPCLLGRGMGVYDAPRSIIEAIPGAELVEMKNSRERSLCCGTSCWTHCTQFSKLMQVNRLREAVSAGAGVCITACDECAMHFSCTLRSDAWQQVNIDVRDVTEFAASLLKDT